MLVTLLGWMVTSFVCWVWGFFFVDFFYTTSQKKLLHFSVICFTGFAILTLLATFVSLFAKVSTFLLFAVTGVALLFLLQRKAGEVLKQNFLQSFSIHFPFLLLLIVGNLLLLVMSVWYILHPDTVDYHATIIDSIKRKGLITGYANENIRYGLQSNWFVACALFSVDFSSPATLTFANTAVLFWFLLFVTGKTAGLFKNKNYFHAFLFLLLLCFSFWDYTQVRLTSTSASPDFIAALYILLAIYFFNQQQETEEAYFLILLFCATAITIKLSSFSLALLLLYLLLLSKKAKTLVPALILLVISVIPFLLRNYFTSGYPFFPATVFQLPGTSWKLNASEVHQVQQYITAYARTASSAEPDTVNQTLALPFYSWIPTWWSLRSLAQKVLLLSSLAALLIGVFHIRKILRTAGTRHQVSLIVTVIGLISWFILAPDPRFGIAWLILVIALILPIIDYPKMSFWINAKAVTTTAYILSVGLSLYLVYRLINFFDPVNLLFPYGLT